MISDLATVLQYLKQPATDHAYMITGPWGAGKTHFWTQEVLPAVAADEFWSSRSRPIPVYVSLYGAGQARRIETSILCQLHPVWANAGRVASVVGQAALERFGVGSAGTKLNFARLLRPRLTSNRLLICFDDLERSAVPVTRVLGHINRYVEHLNAKVLILCNEREILKSAPSGYRRQKEKVVRVTREFVGDHTRAIAAVIDAYALHKEYHRFLQEHRKLIDALFGQSGIRNLRILKYGLTVLEMAFHAIARIESKASDRRSRLVQVVLPVSFDYQSGRLREKDAYDLLADGTATIFARAYAAKRPNGKESAVSRFASRYDINAFTSELGHSKAIADLVVKGYLNEDQLRAEIQAEDAEETPAQKATRNLTRSWYALEDGVFAETVRLSLEAVRFGQVSKWERLISIMRALDCCLRRDLLSESEESLKEAFDAGLNELWKQARFEREHTWRAAHELMLFDGDGELVKWLRKRILDINSAICEAEQKQAIQNALANIDGNATEFARLVRGRDGVTDDIPMVRLLSPSDFVERIAKAPNEAKNEIRLAIKGRYENRAANAALRQDIQWLADVQKILHTRLENCSSKQPSRMLLRDLLQQIDTERKQLEAGSGA